MIARCILSTGADLGLPPRGFYYSERTDFNVTVGHDYQVSGLGIFETALVALVLDDTRKPNWLPAGLFDLSIVTIPASWLFSLIDGKASAGGDASNRWIARWGYAALVEDPAHSDNLIERDPTALAIFFDQLDSEDSDES